MIIIINFVGQNQNNDIILLQLGPNSVVVII